MAIAAVTAALLTSYYLADSQVTFDGVVPDQPVHSVAPWSQSQEVDNSTNLTDVTLSMPPGYLLYDSFTAKNDDIWTVPSYRPNSDFIDTTFVPEGVTFSDGNLVMKSNVDRHLGAEYKTKARFLYGKYRASMRVDQTPGTYQTFFLYTPEPGNHNEIDIELIKSGNVTLARLTTWVDMKKNERYFRLAFDPSKDYHLYGFDWHKDRVDFFIDDMETPIWTSTERVPQSSCYLYLNSWVVTNAPANHGDGLNTQYVDWVTVQPENSGT
jgi:beta-glucanase (GH16 family)